MTQGKTQ